MSKQTQGKHPPSLENTGKERGKLTIPRKKRPPASEELAGHKTINMAIRYAHLMPDQKRAAIQKMGRHATGKVVLFRRASND